MSLIDPRIHQVLDGELSRQSLPSELRPALERREAAAGVLRSAMARRSVAAWVLAEIRRPRPGPMARLARWLIERHAITVSLRPTWSFAVAVLVAAVVLVPSHGTEGPILSAQEGIAQFVGRFPGARSVEVVGSFPDWRSGPIPLQDDDHHGVWRPAAPLPPAQPEYRFVGDRARRVAHPLA